MSALLDWEELTRPMYPEDFTMDRVLAREDTDLKNEASFFRANQSLAPLAQGKRSRRVSLNVHPCVHGYTEWLVDHTSAVEHARWIRAESCRLQVEAKVVRIESANAAYRSEKLLDQVQRLQRRRAPE